MLAAVIARRKVNCGPSDRQGSRWADPLKALGDVLVKLGKTRDALVKYDEALKYAPNLKQLKQAREALVEQKS